MKCIIINTGSELLRGETINTNASFLCKNLLDYGISVDEVICIPDNSIVLKEKLKTYFDKTDFIITTGGLGPTDDDITRESVCDFLNIKCKKDENVFKNMKSLFDKLKKEITPNNLKQTMVPENSIVCINKNATAPGIILKKQKKHFILCPGPPSELIFMYNNYIKDYLDSILKNKNIIKTVHTFNIGESDLETRIYPIIKKYKNEANIATFANISGNVIKIVGNENTDLKIMDKIVSDIESIIYEYIKGYDNFSPLKKVFELLKEKNMSISIAESCTGGLISSEFISLPGISQFFKEGCITYSNEAKINTLNVNEKTLKKYGAVSKQVAIQMAENVSKKNNSNIGLSTTGIAGPSGGTDEKPVGLVYIGLHINGENHFKKLMLNGNRNSIRTKTYYNALYFLLENL